MAGAITKKLLIIEGKKVHDVGYRLFLMDLAEELLIPDFSAKNKTAALKQQVIVHIGGEKKKIDEFIEIANKNHPENADVDNIKVSDYKNDIRTLESFSRSFSASQLSKIATAGVSMINKQAETLKKQDQSVELQKQATEKLDNIHKDLSEKQDKSIELQKQATEKLDNIHKDLSEKQDKTIEILAETKNLTVEKFDKLDKSFHSFHKDTIDRFDVVDKKYGKISETMAVIVRGMNERDNLFETKFLAIEKNVQKSNQNIEALLQILVKQK